VHVYVAVVQHLHIQRHDGQPALVDGLGVFGKVAGFNAVARQRRNIAIIKRRAPPLAVGSLEGRAVAKKPAEKFSWTIRAGDFVRGAIVKIVGTFAPDVGGPAGADETYFLPILRMVVPSWPMRVRVPPSGPGREPAGSRWTGSAVK